MNKTTIKFGIGVVLILSAGLWLALSGFEVSKSYYVTIHELYAMGAQAHKVKIKVAGDVVDGSIQKEKKTVKFVIHENQQTLPVYYVGSDVLPDTFKDGSKAVVEGEYGEDGIFRATHVQAKCASKYESEYQDRTSGDMKQAQI